MSRTSIAIRAVAAASLLALMAAPQAMPGGHGGMKGGGMHGSGHCMAAEGMRHGGVNHAGKQAMMNNHRMAPGAAERGTAVPAPRAGGGHCPMHDTTAGHSGHSGHAGHDCKAANPAAVEPPAKP